MFIHGSFDISHRKISIPSPIETNSVFYFSCFYRWGYALPAQSAFQVLIDIWYGGRNPQLDTALPVLFAYELAGIIVSTVDVYQRAQYACVHVELEEKSSEERIVSTFIEQREALDETEVNGRGRATWNSRS